MSSTTGISPIVCNTLQMLESEKNAIRQAVKKARSELTLEPRSRDPSVDNIANSLILDFFAALPFHKEKRNLLHGPSFFPDQKHRANLFSHLCQRSHTQNSLQFMDYKCGRHPGLATNRSATTRGQFVSVHYLLAHNSKKD